MVPSSYNTSSKLGALSFSQLAPALEHHGKGTRPHPALRGQVGFPLRAWGCRCSVSVVDLNEGRCVTCGRDA